MPSKRLLTILIFVASVFCAAPELFAQCSSNAPGFLDIGLTPGNPFQAERVVTEAGSRARLIPSQFSKPQLIARDSQGRVRIDRVAGKLRMISGSAQGQELEQHIISICDPVAQTLTQLDTVNKTAKITPSRSPSTIAPLGPRISLCAMKVKLARVSRLKPEDLGHRNIQGMDAQGFRFTMPVLVPSAAEGTTSPSTREEWCAEELSVVIEETLVNTHSGAKSETTLAKLERIEPDPTLFQIPPDYTTGELVPQRRVELPHPALGPAQTGSSSPTSSPQN